MARDDDDDDDDDDEDDDEDDDDDDDDDDWCSIPSIQSMFTWPNHHLFNLAFPEIARVPWKPFQKATFLGEGSGQFTTS